MSDDHDLNLNDNKSLVLYRKEELLKLTNDIEQLKDLFMELNYIIVTDDDKLSDIEMTVFSANGQTIAAAEKIREANNYSGKATALFLLAGSLVACPVVGVLLGVKYAVIAGIGSGTYIASKFM